MQASSSDPIYTILILALSASLPANVALTKSTDVWHRRLGHCGASVLNILRKNSFVKFKSIFTNSYKTCRLTKSHEFPFTLAEHQRNFPLHLIRFDVWQSPTLFHHSYKYFVLFIDDYSCFTWLYPMKCKLEVYCLFL